ncbi:hypothetical protein BJ508DRAFT_334238 [Ascobolus immersus RN42]|uniref:Uncharacterized protein n=1 Tax=Ascobolus immersus RN42 TaxID=1160509 RepID=A0A3N4HGW2_ASCIM|nr:hypothetical protein BJ508DRAFT_334238 [Ascobolus immersus RN42]
MKRRNIKCTPNAGTKDKVKRAKIKLKLNLDAIISEIEDRNSENGVLLDDPHLEKEETKLTCADAYPLSRREFIAWLQSSNKADICQFIAERQRALGMTEEEIIIHAKSMCDMGDAEPSPVIRPILPVLSTYGSAGRKARKRATKRVRYRNIERKSDAMGDRHIRFSESEEVDAIKRKLDSTDMEWLMTNKGSSQPEQGESRALVEDASSYIRVSDKLASSGLCIEDSDYNTVIDLLPANEIHSKHIRRLESTFQKLCDDLPDGFFERDEKRFSRSCQDSERDGVLHIGIWNQATWQHERPACSSDLRGGKLDYKTDRNHLIIQQFLVENETLFRFIGGVFKRMDEKLFAKYNSIDLPPCIDKTLFWPFCMMAINRNCYSLPHKDLNDFARGFCFLLCWGKFKGGEVTFKELGMKLPLKRGQLLIFRSALLTHWNQPVTSGIRHSLVLFTPARMFDWKRITTTQVLNRWSREVNECLQYMEAVWDDIV